MRLSLSLPSTCEKGPRIFWPQQRLRGFCRRARALPFRRGLSGRRSMAVPHLTATAGPEPTQTVIDDDHLRQMTLGDRGLEREVLEIFVRQAALMLRRISGAKPALAAAAAHTLKGSARGIGAWRKPPTGWSRPLPSATAWRLSRRPSRNSRPQAARRAQRSSRVWPIVLTAPAPSRPVGARATIDPVRALPLAPRNPSR